MKIAIETERLLLREFTRDDLHAFFALVSDPDITRYTGDGTTSLEEVRLGMEQRVFRAYEVHGFGRWAVVEKATGRVIGFAGLKYLDDIHEIDLGYRFLKEYWGGGLATEAAQAVLKYGFEQLRLEKVIAIADVGNVASQRVLVKLGFRFERQTVYLGSDVLWYSRERDAAG